MRLAEKRQLFRIISDLSRLCGTGVALAVEEERNGGGFQVVAGSLDGKIDLDALIKRMETKSSPGDGNVCYRENGVFVLPWYGGGNEKGFVVGYGADDRLTRTIAAIVQLWEEVGRQELENDNLAKEIANRYEQMVLSYRINREIGTIDDPERMLSVALGCILKGLGAKGGSFVSLEKQGKIRELAYLGEEETGEGRKKSLNEEKREKLARICFQRQRPFIANDLSRDPELKSFAGQAQSVLFSPLRECELFVGGIVLINKRDKRGFPTDDLKLVTALADQVAAAMQNARLFADLRQLLVSITETLAATIDAKDPHAAGHSRNVTRVCLELGGRMGFGRERLNSLKLASLLHDIGKIKVREAILVKPSRLTDSEYAEVRTHPETGARLLEHIPQLREVIPIVRHHHERFDGKGYPDGLAGEGIPLESRILAVADSLDAMMSDRSYRRAIGWSRAKKELEKNQGTQFDPEVVDVLLKLDIFSLYPDGDETA